MGVGPGGVDRDGRVAVTASDTSSPKRDRRRALLWAAVVLVVGLVLTAAVAQGLWHDAETDAEARFVEASDQMGRAIEGEVAGYFDKLTDMGAFRAANPDATDVEFDRFVQGTGIFEQLPSLTGVMYLEVVPADELDAFIREFGASHPGFVYFPIAERPAGQDALVLAYYVPGQVDLRLPVGAEISPIRSISDSIDGASATGSGVVASFQDDPFLQQIAEATEFPMLDELLNVDFFMGVPVYEEQPSDVTPGEDQPIGWLAAPVAEFDTVLAAVTEGLPTDLGASLTVDLTGVEGAEASAISRVADREGTAGALADAQEQRTHDFEVEGVAWSLTLWSADDPDPGAAQVALAAGVLATVLAALFAYARVRSRDGDRAVAQVMAEREEFRRAVLDSVTDPMVVLDGGGRILAANPAWAELRGHPQGDGSGAPGADDDPDVDVGRPYVEVLAAQARGSVGEVAAGLQQVTGDVATGRELAEVDVPVDTAAGRRWFAVRMTPLLGGRRGAVVLHSDVTERKRSEAELALRATHDDLTGLLNRAAIEEEMESAMRQARVRESPIAALFLDLDGFKPVNDTFGHAVGDDVLRAVANRISSAVRTSDRVARLGGDEFVVLVGPLNDRADAELTARRILEAMAAPIAVGDLTIPVSASIGVAVLDSPLDGSSAALIELADRAMYRSKESGGGRYSLAP
jgi:diguanylate cyclase (GGDEF)-like protein